MISCKLLKTNGEIPKYKWVKGTNRLVHASLWKMTSKLTKNMYSILRLTRKCKF